MAVPALKQRIEGFAKEHQHEIYRAILDHEKSTTEIRLAGISAEDRIFRQSISVPDILISSQAYRWEERFSDVLLCGCKKTEKIFTGCLNRLLFVISCVLNWIMKYFVMI